MLQHALGLPPHERLQWIDQAPEIREEFRETLRRLLEVQAGVDSKPFLTDPPFVNAGVSPSASAALIGDRVGPYQLLQELGDGGMGSVWLADRVDGALKRKVALKLPRLEWVRGLADRMAMERDILSALEHPNIARLYDAGVDQLGRPYLALEYVEGERLDRYCDSNRLTIRDRVQLFLQVLDAVQYAHVNLVLHRDIKPGNILVNRRGEVRLLDFGIAKLVDDDPTPSERERQTRTSSRAMTPRYASPEQLKQVRLTLTSDIYSLGVVLFELLVGMTPLITADDSRAELERAIVDANIRTASRTKITPDIAERRQSTPSRISRILRGDIDAIIHRAMSSRSLDRYVSAEAFRADLIRWLDGRPVEATPPSRLIALGKFVRRNRLAVSLGAAAVITIISIATVALIQAQEARLESRRATATRDFLLHLFNTANPDLQDGREPTARDLLRAADSRLDAELTGDRAVLADLYATVSNLWLLFGESERSIAISKKRVEILEELGDYDQLKIALLDLAEVALRQANASDLNRTVAALQKVTKYSAFRPGEEASFKFYCGWKNYRDGDLRQANQDFIHSLKLSKIENNSNQILRSLFGQINVAVRKKDRQIALSLIREAQQLLESGGLSEDQTVQRQIEIASAIYALGEYHQGWPLIDKLKNRSEKRFNQLVPSHRSPHLYWLNWALRLRKIDEGLRWFSSYRSKVSADRKSDQDRDFEFQILEIEFLLSAEYIREARESLAKITAQRSDRTDRERLLLAVTKVKVDFVAERYTSVINELSMPLWDLDNASTENISYLIFKHWYRAMSVSRVGSVDFAAAEFIEAERLARQHLGDHHPLTILISVNERISRKSRPTEELGARVLSLEVSRTELEMLEQTLSEDHPIVRELRRRVAKVPADQGLSSGKPIEDMTEFLIF